MEISRTIGRFRRDRAVILLLVVAAVLLAGRAWLRDHSQHNPWAPLDLRDPPGWATQKKLAEGRENAFLSRKLAAIITDLPVHIDLEKCAAHDYDPVRHFSWKTIVSRLLD